MSETTTDTDLRDRIAAILATRQPCLACGRTVACRCYVRDAPPQHERQAEAVLAVVQPELGRAREMANILLSKMDATRTALICLDQAIDGIGNPEEAEVRAAYDDLVATLGLPEELK